MRVLQLIDTLRSGGAEQMAVSYANALSVKIDRSYLCCTRDEGLLKKKISSKVGYIFIRKKNALDIGAILELRSFVKREGINLIQAHGTSWFMAVLVKISLPGVGVKVVWHDHYGKDLKQRNVRFIRMFSGFFDAVISVNEELERWAQKELEVKRVFYIPNFPPERISPTVNEVRLKGVGTFRILCLANLRPQKDHLTLLKAFKSVVEKHDNTTLHLVGKIEQNAYSEQVKEFVTQTNLDGEVFFYGEQEYIYGLLGETDLAVLSSSSEGLPIALLEYGMAGLPVVCTSVGQCESVIEHCGGLVPPGDPEKLAHAISFYIENKRVRKKHAQCFQRQIEANYSQAAILSQVLELFEGIIGQKF